jgi:hypothetical protein
MKIKAFGLIDPEGELAPFTGCDEGFAWATLSHLLGYDKGEFKAKLESLGWAAVPVEISTVEEEIS